MKEVNEMSECESCLIDTQDLSPQLQTQSTLISCYTHTKNLSSHFSFSHTKFLITKISHPINTLGRCLWPTMMETAQWKTSSTSCWRLDSWRSSPSLGTTISPSEQNFLDAITLTVNSATFKNFNTNYNDDNNDNSEYDNVK